MIRKFLCLALLCAGLASCGQDDAVSRGAMVYAEHCTVCHGADLRGGGGVGVPGLNGIPSDLTVLSLKNGGGFPRDAVLVVLADYASGSQRGRVMRPFAHMNSDDLERVRTAQKRLRVPAPQADLLAYLEAAQAP